MTDLDVLKNTIDILDSINVPTALIEQVGLPILHASRNLKILQKAMLDARKQTENGGTGDGNADVH